MALSPNCHILGKLSMGYTAEQQALGREAALAAGYDESDVASPYLPIWSYQIVYGEDRLREYIGNGASVEATGDAYPYMEDYPVTPTVFDPIPMYDVFGNENPGLAVPSSVSTVATTRPLLTARREVQGPNSVFAFMADYNAAQATGNSGANSVLADVTALYTTHSGDPQFGGSQTTGRVRGGNLNTHYWFLGPDEGTIIEYNACSIVAQQIITKVYGRVREKYRDPYPYAADHDPTLDSWTGFGSIGIDQSTQTDLIARTRTVMGIDFWQFTHRDGSNRQVPAFVCPVIPTRTGTPDPEPSILRMLPGDIELVCDYDQLPDLTSIPPPINTSPSGGIPAGGLGGGSDEVYEPFVLKKGRKQPMYPNYLGFLSYDTGLKKWGKAKVNYKQLLDLSPVNTNQGKIVTTNRFGMEAAIYGMDSILYRFDSAPTDSFIKYGKIGMYRIGFTILEEVRVTFRFPVTGSITISSSLDGRNPEDGLVISKDYAQETWCNMGVGAAGRWHTIKISGNYDITHLEYTGYQSGRR